MTSENIAIVGMGISGAILAVHLDWAGFNVTIFNEEDDKSASLTAAGLFNAIIPRRVTKTWMADKLFEYLHGFYPRLEAQTGSRFFHPKPVFHPFEWPKEQNDWLDKARKEDFLSYFSNGNLFNNENSFLKAPLGFVRIDMGGYCDTAGLLSAVKNHFVNKQSYVEEFISSENLEFGNHQVAINGKHYDKVIFCEGSLSKINPYFNWVKFKFAKGELLKVRIPDLKLNEILLGGIFLVSTGDDEYLLGSTYEWDFTDREPTEGAKQKLLKRAKDYILSDIEVLEHRAGIRPAIKDRRPVIGFHPEYPDIGIFNGFGSKAISIAPYWAREFTEVIQEEKNILESVDANRFFSTSVD